LKYFGGRLAHNALDVRQDFRKAFDGQLALGPRGRHAEEAAAVENIERLRGKRKEKKRGNMLVRTVWSSR
jgi:hypothetical protein